MKRKKLTALLMCGTFLMSGCSIPGRSMRDNNNYDLPDNAHMFTKIYDDDIGEMTIDVYGRTYTYFGDLTKKDSEYSVRECLGYVDHEENCRLFTLAEDPDDNYIMMKSMTSLTGYTVFLRANDTFHKDIFTPSYIRSRGYECWCDSGLHYEQPEAKIGFFIMADNVKMIGYECEINGDFACGGETGYVSGKPYDNGELIKIGVTEHELADHADKDKPFNIRVTFRITDTDGNVHEVKGCYERDMMLGAYLCNLEIRYGSSGYYLVEDI